MRSGLTAGLNPNPMTLFLERLRYCDRHNSSNAFAGRWQDLVAGDQQPRVAMVLSVDRNPTLYWDSLLASFPCAAPVVSTIM